VDPTEQLARPADPLRPTPPESEPTVFAVPERFPFQATLAELAERSGQSPEEGLVFVAIVLGTCRLEERRRPIRAVSREGERGVSTPW
jgi:hypothetical protein